MRMNIPCTIGIKKYLCRYVSTVERQQSSRKTLLLRSQTINLFHFHYCRSVIVVLYDLSFAKKNNNNR